ncbi:MAG: hydantoinase/oxoprolinase family protein [Deltaproteobacteria bacterium]|nr:hydantoinase/oxoprolinase family protein [Deltaproteobacteria bacterium]
MIIIGVDTGGTFTDFVYRDGDKWGVYKLLSTPPNPAEAVLTGLNHIAAGDAKNIVHGSTVATNAILERKGVRTALITNKGFEDVIEIGRQNRSRLYDLAYRREPQIVPAELRFGVKERTTSSGSVIQALESDDLAEVIDRVSRAEVESVAVCLLFSFLNPTHERELGRALARLNLPVSLSHEIIAEFREFERTSTTVVNAYVSPRMQRYISYLRDSLTQGDHLRVMQSNGGSISAETSMKESVRTILSGPAGGAVGAYEIGRLAGFDRIISFDMGGTSTDVSLMDGKLSFTLESQISGYPVKVPMIDIHTVGAGGGSIARLDQGGSLRVGPVSAGADPGPICYGRGDQITVTDANLYLGRLIPDHFLGGTMALHPELLEPHFDRMAEELGLTPVELAEGILAVANTAMEKAIRVISVERGYDPREFALFTFGGAGGLHAAYLARMLNIHRVVVPQNPGILSAIGMLMADVIKDYSLTVMLAQVDTNFTELSGLFGPIEARGRIELLTEGVAGPNIILERYLDMRYEGQSYEIIVPFDEDYVAGFHTLHERNYGYRNKDKSVRVVNLRLRVRGIPEKPTFAVAPFVSETPPDDAVLGQRDVYFSHQPVPTTIYNRDRLLTGHRLIGPAIVVEYSSTIVIPPFAQAQVDGYGNLVLEIGQE